MEKKTLISVNIHILFAFFIITIICGGSIIILLSKSNSYMSTNIKLYNRFTSITIACILSRYFYTRVSMRSINQYTALLFYISIYIFELVFSNRHVHLLNPLSLFTKLTNFGGDIRNVQST